MSRQFRVGGACEPDRHYMLPAAIRLRGVLEYVRNGELFVVHAPRQSGKTTALQSLARELTASGEYAALLFSCESARAAGDDFALAERLMLETISLRAGLDLPTELQPPEWRLAGANDLSWGLMTWARACPRPLVLIFDEIDCLRGPVLVSVLSALRSNFSLSPKAFPASIGLCGLRDVRDYQEIWAEYGGSPFNIVSASLRPADFILDEIRELYGQHTADTGQEFSEQATKYVFEVARGQPWLVNALARQALSDPDLEPEDPVCLGHMELARELLIQRRDSHFDSLTRRLDEPRVQKVIAPLLAGDVRYVDLAFNNDYSYVNDLGLINAEDAVEIANPIYHEVILRALAEKVDSTGIRHARTSYLLPDGRIDLATLLDEFKDYWIENSEELFWGDLYHEAAPHIILHNFLQRSINGKSKVRREAAAGTGRVDILIEWPYKTRDGEILQREAIEVKTWRNKERDPHDAAIAQLDGYLDRLGLDSGTLIIVDTRAQAKTQPIGERTTFSAVTTASGREISVLRA